MWFSRTKKIPQANARVSGAPRNLLQRIKRIFTGLIICIILVAAVSIYIYLHKPATLPIKTIRVIGQYNQVSNQEIEATVVPYTQDGLLNLNLQELQQALLQLPWIAQVDIRKVWPDTVVIDLQQQVPVAYWGESSLLSKQGVIFTPKGLNQLPDSLPKFVAPNSQAQLVLDTYKQINQNLSPLNLTVVGINLTERHAWTITLSNGIILILGRDDLMDRLQRFTDVYPKIIGDKADKVVSVDLRYESGLAVQWKKKKPN